jgi:hypothetical protein
LPSPAIAPKSSQLGLRIGGTVHDHIAEASARAVRMRDPPNLGAKYAEIGASAGQTQTGARRRAHATIGS